jgi:hypothetical protein
MWWSFHFQPAGWTTMASDGLVSYCSPDADAPLWHVQTKRLTTPPYLCRPFGSPDGTLIGVAADPSVHALEVRRTSDGEVVMSLEAHEPPEPFGIVAGFDATSGRLAVYLGPQLRLYSIPDAKVIRESVLGEQDLHTRSAIARLIALSDGWWISDRSMSLDVLNEDLATQTTLDFGGISSAAWLGEPAARRLLLTGNGRARVVDTRSGKTLWRANTLLGADQASTAFGARMLATSSDGGVIEVHALPSLEPVVRVRVIPLNANNDLGWVAWTPDGWWDASPGAEQFVTAFRGLTALDAAGVAQRRNAELIRTRISAAATR